MGVIPDRENPWEQKEMERRAIRYLRDEISWHRRAGRLLFGFVVGAGASIALLLLDVTSRPALSPSDMLIALTPGTIPLFFGVVASFYFWRYYTRISTLKSKVQQIVHHRLSDATIREAWIEAFRT